MTQIVIGVFGVLSVILANDPRPRVRRWGCICGLISQPAWFVMTWQAAQYGAFLAAFFYTYGWLRGLCYQWIRPQGNGQWAPEERAAMEDMIEGYKNSIDMVERHDI